MVESVRGRADHSQLRLLAAARRLPGHHGDEQHPGGHPVGERLLRGGRTLHPATYPGKERTMKFRNPWIDPRIVQARPESARAYLLCHGWKSPGPAVKP